MIARIIRIDNRTNETTNKIIDLRNEIKQLKEDNKLLNQTLNKQNTEIQDLKNRLDKSLQINQNKNKDKINETIINKNIEPKQLDKKVKRQPKKINKKKKQLKKVKNKRRHKKPRRLQQTKWRRQ